MPSQRFEEKRPFLIDADDGRQLRAAWGNLLSKVAWSQYLTLTSDSPISADRLLQDFRQRYVRRAEQLVQRPVYWFAVVEGIQIGFPHLHALMAGTNALSITQLERLWKRGYTRILQYDPGKGAAHYIVKEFGPRNRDWDVYDIVPPPGALEG